MVTQTSYATNIDYPAGTVFGYQNGSNYKSWDDLDNLKTAGGIAQCRNPNNTDTPTIAGRNGTYKRPAPLEFTGFAFDTTDMYNVEKVIVHYTQGKFINNGYYPEFGGATFTLLGTNTTSQTGAAIPAVDSNNNGTHYTLTFTGISISQLNNLSLRVAYPSNTATTPGRIKLSNVYLEVVYNENVSVVLSGSFNKSPVNVNSESTVTVTAKKTGNYAYNSTIDITLPSGLSYVSNLSNETITTGEDVAHHTVLHWNPTFNAVNNTSKTIQFKVRATTVGTKTINVKENTLGSSYSFSQVVNKITHIVWSDINKRSLALTEDREHTFHVDIKGDSTTSESNTVTIDVTGVNSLDYAELMTNQYVDVLQYENKRFTIQYTQPPGTVIRFTFKRAVWTVSGNYTLTVQIGNDDPVEFHYIVNPRVMGDLSFCYYKLPDYYTEDMAGGIRYTIGTTGKLLFNSDDYNITDGGDNFRIGVYNGSLDDMYTTSSHTTLDEETFLAQTLWCDPIATAEGVEQSVNFTYNENNPIIFVYSYTYVNDPVSQVVRYNFTEPYLVETSIYDTVDANGYRAIVPHPARALLGDTRWAVCTIPTMKEAVPVALTDWLDGGLFTEEIAIHGLQVQFDYNVDNNVMIEVEVTHGTKTGVRTLLLRKGRGTATVGSAYDLFDFQIGDLIEDLEDMEIRIHEVNNFETTVKPQINNARITVYYVQIAKCRYGFSVDGARSEWYGIYLMPDFEPHMATKNDKSEYHVEGTDETIINRLNIDPKTLTLSIKVPNCTIQEGMPQIDRIVDLFTNEREIYSHKPIPKHIVFDIMPDRQYEFVRIDEFDDEFEGATYKAKIKLYVPMGTSYNIDSTITGGEGYNGSNTMVKPIVTARCDTNGQLTVTESYMNQYMRVETENLHVGDIVTFDCINHKVYIGDNADITTITDISSSLDFNSSWFKIKGRYSFTSTDGTIFTVEYYPRR